MALQSITGVATPHLELTGLATSYIDITIIVHSVSLVAFKFLTGVIYDKLGLRKTVSICAIAGVVVFMLLALVDSSIKGFIFALIYSTFSSLALPLETIMLPIYANDLFGEKPYEKTLGIIVSVNTLGYALGSYLAELCRKFVGGYTPILFIGSAILVLVLVVVQFVINASNKEKKKVFEQENQQA